jgi:hypothetical protein
MPISAFSMKDMTPFYSFVTYELRRMGWAFRKEIQDTHKSYIQSEYRKRITMKRFLLVLLRVHLKISSECA